MTHPTEAQADIVERLTAMYSHRGDGLPTQYVNPDGLEAATEITRLRAQLAEAELRGVKAGLEAGAQLAQERHEQWRMPHPDDAKPGEVCDDVSACRDIANAIRAIDPTTLTKDAGHGE